MLLNVVGGHAAVTGVQYNNTTVPGFTGLLGATGVSNLWDRESILRYTGSNGIEGARIHKGIGLDDTCNDPAVTDFTWEQKDPLAGQHRFGNRDAVQAIIGPVGVAGCTGVLSVGGLQFGSSAVSISDVKTLICNTSLTYQTINKFVAMTISSANTANEIKPYWRAPTSNVPESLATTSTWTRALGLQTQVIPTGQTYQPGDYVLMATTTKVTWLTNWWTKYFLWGYVTAYNAGTGSMTMNVLVCGGGAGGTLVNSFVMAAFPWMPSCLVSSYYETVDGVQCGLYPTPVNMYWAENHGITLQSVSFMCDFLA
jgi:hypothetical protein